MNDRIKKLRLTLNMTQAEFASHIGVKRNTVSAYESGRNSPITSVVNLICSEFNVSKSWLLYGEGKMFDAQPYRSLDSLAADNDLSVFDYLLLEKYMTLKKADRNAVVRYVQQVADAMINTKAPASVSKKDDNTADTLHPADLDSPAQDGRTDDGPAAPADRINADLSASGKKLRMGFPALADTSDAGLAASGNTMKIGFPALADTSNVELAASDDKANDDIALDVNSIDAADAVIHASSIAADRASGHSEKILTDRYSATYADPCPDDYPCDADDASNKASYQLLIDKDSITMDGRAADSCNSCDDYNNPDINVGSKSPQ